MDDHAFDDALIASAFRIAAERGWPKVSVAEAARQADLPLDRARARFPMQAAIALRLGLCADQAALALAPREGPHRDRLFDLIMRRIDTFQANRAGVLALLRALPADPCLSALLGAATLRSMAWMLEGAGIDATGVRGGLRAHGLLAVWLATVRAWRNDEGEELSATMAALDRALRRAEQVEGWMCRGRRAAAPADAPAAETPSAEPPSGAAPPNVSPLDSQDDTPPGDPL